MKENQQVEWKESWHDTYLKWICGFANAEGGVLVIGRDDQGVAVGVQGAKKLMEDLPNKIRDILGIMVDVNLREEAGKDTVEIVVKPYPYPVSYKGEYHYRSGSTKQELKGAALDRFLLAKQGRHWDGISMPGFGIDDLAPQTLSHFRKLAKRSGRVEDDLLEESDAVLIDKLHLLDRDLLKRAALLLFGKDPERLVTGAYLKIGFFRTDSDLLYHDEIHGDLFTQVDRGLDLLLTKYLRYGISYEGAQRIETLPVPEKALREALINAIVHKDYAAAIPIQVSVYHDKLMIWNPGHLPQGWTLADLTAKHASYPFNPDVANAFFRTAYLESWGRGIDLIRDTCDEHGCPQPLLRWDNGLWVEFNFADTPQVTPQVTPHVTPHVERLLAVLHGDMDRASIQAALNLKDRKSLHKRYLKPALEVGLIAMTMPDKPHSRLQCYRLTTRGEAQTASQKKPETTQEAQEGVGENPQEGVGENQEGVGENQEGVGENSQEGVGENQEITSEDLSETKATIVKAILADPKVTTTQLAQSLSISTKTVEKHLQRLKALDYIERVGPAKGGHWKVKRGPS